MGQINILWADDEIELLKPQIIFLESKGYTVTPVNNGQDAIDACKKETFDVVFLDDSMPGLSGLETLYKIKETRANIPIVMITKNEEENLMEDAIGSKISDYLIKPVKPQQILLSLKKLIDNDRLVSEKTTSNYQQEFQKIFISMQDDNNFEAWSELYKKLVYWELELQQSGNTMSDVFAMQKSEANTNFCKYISKNYLKWIEYPEAAETPVLTYNVLAKKVFHLLKQDKSTVLIVIDNLRLDQWKTIQPLVQKLFKQVEDDTIYSILPTATQYSRNAIFAGMMPGDIEKSLPQFWRNDDDEGGKNMFEEQLLDNHLKRVFKDEIKMHYHKVTNFKLGEDLVENIGNWMNNKLNVIVYNFVDMLSHARTEMEVLKELASDEKAYRSLTLSWFEHSALYEALKKIATMDINLVITTDHGTIRVNSPSKCVGDRQTSTNIRYKTGRNLAFEERDVFVIKDPAKAKLPKSNITSTYIFAKENNYLVYQNNYNQFANYYKDTFQHGGVSLEEIIIPFATFVKK
jgi:DNA-binding response OmpR family regulator